MASVEIRGLDELSQVLGEIIKRLNNPELVTEPLALGMETYVHRVTGHLASTIEYEGNFAGATAPYAGVESDRGGSHDYASQAIEAFDLEGWADKIVEGF